MTAPTGQKGRSVFWKVAPALVGLQLFIVAVSAALTVTFVRDALETLASAALAARLDATAEEIERRSGGLDGGYDGLDPSLLLDLQYRFPDPLLIVDLNGDVFGPVWPADDAFDLDSNLDSTWAVPDYLELEEAYDNMVIDLSNDEVDGGFASAPLYDAGGFPTGLLLVQPLSRSLEWELSESRAALVRSARTLIVFAIGLALLFGAFLTWWLVRPVRDMSQVVSRMDGEHPEYRIAVKGGDEMAVLGRAINQMADRVATSIQTLRQTDQLRRELVANVGHDLRTPLAGIRVRIEEAGRMLEEGRSEEASDSLLAAQRQVDYISRLIEDLFELSRMEGHASPLRLEPVLPAELVNEAVGMYRSAASQAGIDLQLDVAQGLPRIEADGTRLLRLLGNLLSNAVRHTPEGGQVRVRVTASGHLVIQVSDTGPGLDEDARERIFDRYYRGEDARTRADHQRTGLGLAIARAVAEAHGGELVAISLPGEGTTMQLTLPLGPSVTHSSGRQ